MKPFKKPAVGALFLYSFEQDIDCVCEMLEEDQFRIIHDPEGIGYEGRTFVLQKGEIDYYITGIVKEKTLEEYTYNHPELFL